MNFVSFEVLTHVSAAIQASVSRNRPAAAAMVKSSVLEL